MCQHSNMRAQLSQAKRAPVRCRQPSDQIDFSSSFMPLSVVLATWPMSRMAASVAAAPSASTAGGMRKPLPVRSGGVTLGAWAGAGRGGAGRAGGWAHPCSA